VPEWVRAYPQMLRASMQVTLAYRGRLMFLLTGALFPMLMLFVWLTVEAGGQTAPGWDVSRFVSYYAAAAVVYNLTSSEISWSWDKDMRSGELSNRLLRPMPVFHQFAAFEAGERIVTLVVLAPMLIVSTIVLPAVEFPVGITSLLAAVVATLLAFALGVVTSSTFALIGFWTTQSLNVYLLWWGLGAFASGWVAPLELMPDWLRHTAEVLPFRYSLGFPAEIALGLSPSNVIVGFAIALLWLVLFVGVYKVLWRRGVRHYQAVGG